MIGPPKRAVTRFFIPLIDVLILLFCIFLLMPYVEKGAVGGARLTAGEAERLQRELDQLRQRLSQSRRNIETPEDLKQEIARLKKQLKQNPADKLVIRSLQIDENDGSLFYLKPTPEGGRVRIRLDQEKARQLVLDDHKPPFRQGEQKLVYLMVRPQKKSLFPTESQLQEYLGWFTGLPVDVRMAEQDPFSGGRTP
jgi:hypothetical protein